MSCRMPLSLTVVTESYQCDQGAGCRQRRAARVGRKTTVSSCHCENPHCCLNCPLLMFLSHMTKISVPVPSSARLPPLPSLRETCSQTPRPLFNSASPFLAFAIIPKLTNGKSRSRQSHSAMHRSPRPARRSLSKSFITATFTLTHSTSRAPAPNARKQSAAGMPKIRSLFQDFLLALKISNLKIDPLPKMMNRAMRNPLQGPMATTTAASLYRWS